MTIRFQRWRQLTRIGAIVALPVIVFALEGFNVGSLTIPLRALAIVFTVLFGLVAVAVSILQRCGVLEFHYTDNDKKRLDYRAARSVAKIERKQGRRFSNRYYEGYDLVPPNKSNPGDEAEA